MNDHLNTVVFRGIVLQILRGAYGSVRCMQVLLSNLSPSTMLWTGYVVWFTIVSTQIQANMGVGGMSGKCILLLLWIISKSKNLEQNLLELGKLCHLNWWPDVEREAWKLAQISVLELTGKGTRHLFQVSLLFLRISVPCLIVWLEFLTLGKLLNQLNLWVWFGDWSVEALSVTGLRI